MSSPKVFKGLQAFRLIVEWESQEPDPLFSSLHLELLSVSELLLFGMEVDSACDLVSKSSLSKLSTSWSHCDRLLMILSDRFVFEFNKTLVSKEVVSLEFLNTLEFCVASVIFVVSKLLLPGVLYLHESSIC